MATATIPNQPSTCLCLGPNQSGKTHLLLSLKTAGSINNVTHSVPTIGTNIYTIKFPDASNMASTSANKSSSTSQKAANTSGRQQRNLSITIMEIGGSMAPMWAQYLGNVSKILYVIDTSNLCQISAAGNFSFLPFIQTRIAFLSNIFCNIRCPIVFVIGRSTATAHKIFARSHQNGFGVSSNAKRSIANATIQKIEKANSPID